MSSPGMVAPGQATPDTSMAMLAHLLGLFTGFLGPLVIYLTKRDDDAFTRFHAAEALNFQISIVIAWIGTFILFFVIIGFFLLPVLLVLQFLFPIMGSVKSNRGEWWKYPLNIRFVS